MDLLLSAVALALIPLAGAGVLRLVAPKGRPVESSELAGLSLVVGIGIPPILLAAFSLLLRGAPLRGAVLVGLGTLAAAGYMRARRNGGPPVARLRDVVGTALLLVVAILVGGAVVRGQTLGWDGIFVWEMKARIVFANEGRFPLSYFVDPTRRWSHPGYPPLLPLLESWLYGWLGRPDQILLDMLGLLQLVAALLLVRFAGERFSGRAGGGFAAAALFLFVPGFVTSRDALGFSLGYADFLLGLFYGAALFAAVLAAETGETFWIRIGGLMTALLPLVKREGNVLAGSVVLLAAVAFLVRRRGRAMAWIALPPLVTGLGWALFLMVAKAPPNAAFLPATPANLAAGLPRLAELRPLLLSELANPEHWSLLFPAAILVALVGGLLDPPRRLRRFVLAGGCFLPLVGTSAAFVLSRWSVAEHAAGSLSRLALHLAFPAFLVLVSSFEPPWARRTEAEPPAAPPG